jgi:hypothetical protein
MALTGTLEDFGIAEILQLIGQQAKTGLLHLHGRGEEIHIGIADGCVVRAETAGRKARERLGNMLVRAELIGRHDLDRALDLQKRTLRRLGDILVEEGLLSKAALKEMTALQTTETVYRLFHWKRGTYAFEPGEVEWDRETVTPLRAESVLMEGFRQVDEWPLIRTRITSTAMTFERLRALDPAWAPGERAEPRGGDVDTAFDALGVEPVERKGEFASFGPKEQRIHALAEPGRTVEAIVDLSRLGEFETCKALLALVNLGYLRPVPPARRKGAVGTYGRDGLGARLRRGAARIVATVALAAALAGIAAWVDERGLAAHGGAGAVGDNAAGRFLARAQQARLRAALDVYRVERGEYPPSLGALVDEGLASPRDLRHPWSAEWYYRRTDEGRFVLLPPVE